MNIDDAGWFNPMSHSLNKTFCHWSHQTQLRAFAVWKRATKIAAPKRTARTVQQTPAAQPNQQLAVAQKTSKVLQTQKMKEAKSTFHLECCRSIENVIQPPSLTSSSWNMSESKTIVVDEGFGNKITDLNAPVNASRTSLKTKPKVPKKPWTEAEELHLRSLVLERGANNWTEKAKLLRTGRTAAGVRQHWSKMRHAQRSQMSTVIINTEKEDQVDDAAGDNQHLLQMSHAQPGQRSTTINTEEDDQLDNVGGDELQMRHAQHGQMSIDMNTEEEFQLDDGTFIDPQDFACMPMDMSLMPWVT